MSVKLEVAELTVDGHRVPLRADATLFELARRAGVSIPNACQENGKCRECLVQVDDGHLALSPPTIEEDQLQESFRLACRARVTDPKTAIRCRTLRHRRLRIETCGDLQRPASGDPTANGRGLAIDIGTTSVVLRLIELATGEVVDARAFENPQCVAGADVMSRIAFDGRDDSGFLRRTLLGFLGREIRELSGTPTEIRRVVVVGNPTMRDLFFGLDVAGLGQRPYRSLTADRESIQLDANTSSLGRGFGAGLDLGLHPEARVFSPAQIGGHVGSDAAASLLVADLAHHDRPRALLDIGTNTELVVAHGDRILAASCPAGPAFEGGGITCGMPAFDGAIANVRRTADGLFDCDVLGDARATGICGSGLIAAVAVFLESGLMNELGRFVDGSNRIYLDVDETVFLTERDVAELAQAKSAHAAGLQIVAKQLGIRLRDLDTVFLCGAFGHHLDPGAAMRIGLISELTADRIKRLGNTAIEGAAALLSTPGENHRLAMLVEGIEHVNLETDPDFFDLFAEGCLFRPLHGD